MTQKRWRCIDCLRQWVYATNWEADQGCPLCKSSRIEFVTYDAVFAGADIGTTLEELPCVPPVSPEPLPAPEWIKIAENRTLAMSSPEFG